MSLKRTGFWVLTILAASVLFVGRLTGFTYRNLEIQLHDTYYVFDPYTIGLITVITLGLASMLVSSIKILRNHHLLLRIVIILISAAILFIPMVMLYTLVLTLFAG